MRVLRAHEIGFTTYATIVADEGEKLTEEAIAEKYFTPFGGVIVGFTEDLANVRWYND